MKLVIVESPTKQKTIAKYLGKDYRVLASFGHIRDLNKEGEYNLGVDIVNGFTAGYEIVPGREKLIDRLEKAVEKADEVLLATDPDREGEAISWHLAQTLNLDVSTTQRLSFHEITPYGIQEALQKPGIIDMNLVHSQETRRILDRIIGFRLSSLLQAKIRSRSGGRVQSAVLKLVVERDREVQAFVSQEYWEMEVDVQAYDQTASVKLIIAGEDTRLNQEQIQEIHNRLGSTLLVEKVEVEEKKYYARPPFTTSTLQQEAFSKLRYPIKKTMQIAQQLYEGIEMGKKMQGLITYMRTDSIRLSPLFINQAKQVVTDKWGEDYVGTAYKQGGSDKVQDAHEAIRPADVRLSPEEMKQYLTPDQWKLYELIYSRALASVMKPRVMKETKVTLSSGDIYFERKDGEQIFKGYSSIYGKYEQLDSSVALPWVEQDLVTISEVHEEKKKTKAPNHYSEGQLVRVMEELGIGRPSTYVATIDTLKARQYVQVKRGQLVPTMQGSLTIEKLEEYFSSLIDAKYTAEMEKDLDQIADGKEEKVAVLSNFYDGFSKALDFADEHMEKVDAIQVGENCPQCGKPLGYRKGKFGEFVGCSGYPECTYRKTNETVVPENAKDCPKCKEGKLVMRRGKFGAFLACNRYPKCDYKESFRKTKK